MLWRLDDVQVSQAKLIELLSHVAECAQAVAVVNTAHGAGRREANAHAVGAEHVYGRLHYFEGKASAVFDAAAVLVGALVGAILDKLVYEVAIGAVNLNAVESGRVGVFGSLAEVFYHRFHFASFERARGRNFFLAVSREGFHIFRLHGRRSYGQLAILEERVGNGAYVPKLNENAPTRGVHGIGHFFPACYLVFAINTGCIDVAHALLRNLRALGDEQARRGALHIILHR
jgi:hypothetical protein